MKTWRPSFFSFPHTVAAGPFQQQQVGSIVPSTLGVSMSVALRFVLAAVAALFLALPAQAAQTGSAAWTTDGWVSMPAFLRTGPGTRYDEAGSIAAGERVRVDRCSNRWCQIHTSKVRGWLSLDNLSFGQQPDGLFAGPKFNTGRGATVCFYTGSNFTGASFCANSGRVIRDLKLIGFDNAIVSVEVGGGSAMVCRDRGFRSYCQTIDASSEGNLVGLLSRDVSSIRVW